jgi:ABC-2 type transport system permease protein
VSTTDCASPGTTPDPESVKLPSALSVGWARGRLEIKQFFRERDSVVFSFALPVVFLALFGVIFGSDTVVGTTTYSQLLVPSMLTLGIASTTLVNIGIWIAVDRDNGTLRRLTTTPMPRIAYFLGKIVMMVVVGLIESAILLVAGVLMYGVQLPATPEKWLTLTWVVLLAFAVCGTLGVALSSLPRSSRSAAAVINFPVLVLQFLSGIFIPFNQLPDWLYTIGAFFPLKWIAQGLRAAFLPDEMAVIEPAGSFELGRVALVLLAWLAVAVVLCLTTFRWKRRGEG